MNPIKQTGKDHMKGTAILSPTTQESLAKLNDHVKSPNFVYIVGYSLEKVHSGVLCSLLRSQAGPQLAASLWNRSHEEQVRSEDITVLRADREQRIGKAGIVDLVFAFADTRTKRTHHVVCEFKVDGT